MNTQSLEDFFDSACEAIKQFDLQSIDRIIDLLADARDEGGRLFILGVGGSAGHASHATNDFRKLCDFEAYCVTDNVSELTARINDEGWDTAMSEYLRVSRIRSTDVVLVFSVGGGNVEAGVSTIIVEALRYAQGRGARICGIVGRDGGFTKSVGSEVIVIPTVDESLVTPIVEGLAAVIWHAIISDPRLARRATKW